jgi:hypothetical protein
MTFHAAAARIDDAVMLGAFDCAALCLTAAVWSTRVQRLHSMQQERAVS